MNPLRFLMNVGYRRSIRLRGYDYSRKGLYFVTICAQNRVNLFGHITDSARMILNEAGEMIDTVWNQTINDYLHVKSNKYIIMPNHFHCIIEIGAVANDDVTVGDIVQSFKRNTTVKYIAGVKSGMYLPFNRRVWQRNYYEHIIRDNNDYEQIAEYISNNPTQWQTDRFYM